MGAHNVINKLLNVLSEKLPASGRMFNLKGVGWLFGWGQTAPSSQGWATGAIFVRCGGAVKALLSNTGTSAAAVWRTVFNATGLFGDTITEITADAGVTVDGVLCKDGVVKVGAGGYVEYADAATGVAGGNGTVKMNGATARDSTGWVTVVCNGQTRYIPVWTTITG